MENEILVALLTKLVDDRITEIQVSPGHRGPRGLRGTDGRDFVFEDHEEEIKTWAKQFALKFEDLSVEQIKSLRGPRGRKGVNGKDFIFKDHRLKISEIIKNTVNEMSDSLKLKFSDLSPEDIKNIRGPRGREGREGKDGKDFVFEEYAPQIQEKIKETVDGIRDDLKLKFEDLESEEINEIRGPRGRDGRDGKDFVFEEYQEFFESLKLTFSDLAEEEKDSLKIHFSDLTDDERSALKLKFKDLTQEDISLIRGPRGPRGQKGSRGIDGISGPMGPRGLPGLMGVRGLTGLTGISGVDGRDGKDGADAPRIVDISVEQYDNDIEFIFEFSDGFIIRTDRLELPKPVNFYATTGGSVKAKMNYETRIDEVSATLTYVGKSHIGSEPDFPTWQISRILTTGTETVIEYADSNDYFDNVWDDRASLTYG